jgi:prevent-host-death family protein
MKASSNIKPLAYMKTHSAELVKSVNDSRSPVVITQNGQARAVIMDAVSYEQMQDALVLLKMLSKSDEEYRKGHWKSQKEVEADFRKRFPD